MSVTITLPREAVKLALEALEWSWGGEPMGTKEREAITALRTALAAEQQKPEPVATVGTQIDSAWKGYDGKWCPPGDPTKVVHLLRDLPVGTLLYTAPPEDEALRRDAERYRWMKQEVKRIPPSWGLIGWDAAIDAAMEGKT